MLYVLLSHMYFQHVVPLKCGWLHHHKCSSANKVPAINLAWDDDFFLTSGGRRKREVHSVVRKKKKYLNNNSRGKIFPIIGV